MGSVTAVSRLKLFWLTTLTSFDPAFAVKKFDPSSRTVTPIGSVPTFAVPSSGICGFPEGLIDELSKTLTVLSPPLVTYRRLRFGSTKA